MKNSLFLYLFVLAVLMNVFTYMYFHQKDQELQSQFDKRGTRFDSLLIKSSDADYFSLENNENAQNYFNGENVKKQIDYVKLIPYVKDQLMEYNSAPTGNKFTGQDSYGDKKFIINKAKVLNHRWIIADFTDGNYWGEVLLKYFVNEDNSIDFEVIQSLVYVK